MIKRDKKYCCVGILYKTYILFNTCLYLPHYFNIAYRNVTYSVLYRYHKQRYIRYFSFIQSYIPLIAMLITR